MTRSRYSVIFLVVSFILCACVLMQSAGTDLPWQLQEAQEESLEKVLEEDPLLAESLRISPRRDPTVCAGLGAFLYFNPETFAFRRPPRISV